MKLNKTAGRSNTVHAEEPDKPPSQELGNSVETTWLWLAMAYYWATQGGDGFASEVKAHQGRSCSRSLLDYMLVQVPLYLPCEASV